MDLSGRIAICLSGQIRTGVENAPALLNYIGELKDGVDVFIHTWNIETESPWTADNRGNQDIANIRRTVPADTVSKISKLYRPLDMRVDDFDIYQTCHHDRVTMRSQLCAAQIPMFQSIWESNQLKVAHEQLCHSKYNIVVRLRFDVDFGPGRTLLEDMQYMAEKKDFLYFVDFANKFPDMVEDVCWMTSSAVMDTVCQFAIERETNIVANSLDWQTHLSKYLKDKNVVTRPYKNNNITIHRNKFVGTAIVDTKD
jgi:hypothetical protein